MQKTVRIITESVVGFRLSFNNKISFNQILVASVGISFLRLSIVLRDSNQLTGLPLSSRAMLSWRAKRLCPSWKAYFWWLGEGVELVW
jgi:hypothetical protein